jgi:hypothetical protein
VSAERRRAGVAASRSSASAEPSKALADARRARRPSARPSSAEASASQKDARDLGPLAARGDHGRGLPAEGRWNTARLEPGERLLRRTGQRRRLHPGIVGRRQQQLRAKRTRVGPGLRSRARAGAPSALSDPGRRRSARRGPASSGSRPRSSASRMAFSRSPASGARRAAASGSALSRPRPSSVQSACRRPSGEGSLAREALEQRDGREVLARDQQPLRGAAPPQVRMREVRYELLVRRLAELRGSSCGGGPVGATR